MAPNDILVLVALILAGLIFGWVAIKSRKTNLTEDFK